MASYDLTGRVKLIMDQQNFDSGFTKREFVVTVEDGRFPQDIKFECVKDKCSLLDSVSEGQEVKVSFDIRGNEYKGRYYVNLNAWRVEQADAAPAGVAEAGDDERPPIDQYQELADGEEDVIPF